MVKISISVQNQIMDKIDNRLRKRYERDIALNGSLISKARKRWSEYVYAVNMLAKKGICFGAGEVCDYETAKYFYPIEDRRTKIWTKVIEYVKSQPPSLSLQEVFRLANEYIDTLLKEEGAE